MGVVEGSSHFRAGLRLCEVCNGTATTLDLVTQVTSQYGVKTVHTQVTHNDSAMYDAES